MLRMVYLCPIVTLSLRPGLRVTRGHRNRRRSIRQLRFPINVPYIATMGLSRTVFEINGDFGRKSQNFLTPHVFCALWSGSPWNWVPALRSKTRKLEWWRYRAEKEVWRHLQPCEYNAPTWQTDRRTDGQTDRHRATAKTSFTHSIVR